MTHTMKAAQIEAKKLIDHPANVRAKSVESSGSENIAHLKASIEALGLIQPLLVQEIKGGYGVLAGKRRAAAIHELIADKSAKGFPKSFKVDCRVIPKDCDTTTALSLAENITQERMGPIDEFEAFQRMMEIDHQTPETIAHIFGTTVVAVKTRLRYGLIHPDIRQAARTGDITLDTMKAFADHPSQDVQKDTFDALTQDGRRPSAYGVRDALKTRGVQVSDPLGVFVRETYETRGGAVARDLIDEHSVLEDMTLVETILLEQLKEQAEAEKTKLGFAWADAHPTYDHQLFSEYDRVYPEALELDDDTQTQVDEIEAKLEALQAEMEDEAIPNDVYDAKYDEADALEDQLRDLQEGYSDENLAVVGVIAYWSRDRVEFLRGLVAPEPVAISGEDADGTTGGCADSNGDGGGSTNGKRSSNTDELPDADEITYSTALADDLKTERAMALGAALTQNPEVATDLAMFQIVGDIFCHRKPTYAIEINASSQMRAHAKKDEIDETSVEQVAAAFDALDLSWNDQDASPAKRFAGFRALSPSEKAKLVAYAVGTTTRNTFARNANADPLMHDLEIEIMPDLRAHWAPNAAFFGRLKKAWLLGILSKDLGLQNEAVQLANSPKKDIVAFMDTLFSEPFATLTEAQVEAIEAWCPPSMQTTQYDVDDQVPDKDTDSNDANASDAKVENGDGAEGCKEADAPEVDDAGNAEPAEDAETQMAA